MITDHEPLSAATLATGHVVSALASLNRMFGQSEAEGLLELARAIETRQAELESATWNARVAALETARGCLYHPKTMRRTNKICSSVTTALEKEEEEGRTNLQGQRFSARSVHRRSLSWEEPIIAGQAS